MAAQSNCTTLEPMAEAEAMQASSGYDLYSYSPGLEYGCRFVHFKGKDLRMMYDPESDIFSPDEYPFDDITDEAERNDYEWWTYENSLDAWGKYLRDEVPRAISELKELSSRVMDERGRHTHALKHLEGIKKQGYEYYEVEYIQQAKDLLDDMRTWINELKAKIRTEIKTLESGAVFLVSRSFLSAPRTSSRSPRRSPVRSSAKSGGDDGGGDDDGDSDGEPPRALVHPSAPDRARSIPVDTHESNRFHPSRRLVLPRCWRLSEGRCSA